MYGIGRNIKRGIRIAKNWRTIIKPYGLFVISADEELHKKTIDFRMKFSNRTGISNIQYKKHIVVSLTSFPKRMDSIHYCLFSLFNQTMKPNAIVLWLAEDEFPNKEKDIPKNVLRFKKNGLSVLWTENTKSYKKLLPSLALYKNSIIITVDDDIYYNINLVKELYDDYIKNECNTFIYANRVRKILIVGRAFEKYIKWPLVKEEKASYGYLATTGGGTLYPPGSLHKDVFSDKLHTRIAPTADDVGFWAMAVKNGTKTKKAASTESLLVPVNPNRQIYDPDYPTLSQINVDQGKNDEQLCNIITEYPEILDAVLAEAVNVRVVGTPRSGTNLVKFLVETRTTLCCGFNMGWWKHAVIPALVTGTAWKEEETPTIVMFREPVEQMASFYNYTTKGNFSLRSEARSFSEFIRKPMILTQEGKIEYWFTDPVSYWIQFYWALVHWSGKKLFFDLAWVKESPARAVDVLSCFFGSGIRKNNLNVESTPYMGRNADTPVDGAWRFDTATSLEQEERKNALLREELTSEDRAFILREETTALYERLQKYARDNMALLAESTGKVM